MILLGNILNEYWNIKKKLSFKVTNPIIDEIYNESLIAGASEWKINWIWWWRIFIGLL